MNRTTWYYQFNRVNHPLVPSKEEYEAYVYPVKMNRRTGTYKPKEMYEMTIKEISYHSYILNYKIWNKNNLE